MATPIGFALARLTPRALYSIRAILSFFDAASIEFFRAFGYPPDTMQAAGLEPVLVEVNIRYHVSARLDQLLHIHVSCPRLGNTSFDLVFEARIQDPEDGSLAENLTASAIITYVNVNQKNP